MSKKVLRFRSLHRKPLRVKICCKTCKRSFKSIQNVLASKIAFTACRRNSNLSYCATFTNLFNKSSDCGSEAIVEALRCTLQGAGRRFTQLGTWPTSRIWWNSGTRSLLADNHGAMGELGLPWRSYFRGTASEEIETLTWAGGWGTF